MQLKSALDHPSGPWIWEEIQQRQTPKIKVLEQHSTGVSNVDCMGERVRGCSSLLRYFVQNSYFWIHNTLNVAFWSLAAWINARRVASWGLVIPSLHSHWYALAVPVSSASPASSSIRQKKEGRFFALLFKTFEKLLALSAGFLIAGFF